MAENITSLLVKDELAAADALTTDVIYIVHGTGTPRDRKMTVAELRKLINQSSGKFVVDELVFTDGTSTYSVMLSADGDLEFYTGIKCDHVFTVGDSAFGGDVSVGAGKKFLGNLEGNVTGDSTGNHKGKVLSSEIIAETAGGVVEVGRTVSVQGQNPDTFNHNGVEIFKRTARFDGLHITKGAVASSIQYPTSISQNGKLLDLVVAGAPVVSLRDVVDLEEGSKVDLALTLSGTSVNLGQRFTIVTAGETVRVDVADSSRLWRMDAYSGCEFLVTDIDTVKLVPIGTGQWVSRS